MRRILAFLVLLILPWAVRGQALADWYYWFDTDAAPRDSGKVSEQQFQLQTDVSHLPTGVHTLYVQVADTAGVFSPPFGTFFFKVPDISNIDKLFYTIDAEKEAHAIDFGNGTFSLDVSSCSVGFHTINLQVMDKQGGACGVMPYLFYKVPIDGQLSHFRYWFDSDGMVREQPYGQGQYLLDVSGLMPGFHFINFYVNDGENNMTDVQHVGFFRLPVEANQKLHYWFSGDTISTRVDNYREGFLVDVSRLKEGFNTIFFQMEDNGTSDIYSEDFLKVPQTEGVGDMTVLCVIDGKTASEQKLPINGGIIKWDMDVSNIDVGLHKAMFQIVTPSGAGSSIAETYFIRTITDAEVGTMQCSYVIDGFKHYTHKGTQSNGVFHFDLPVDDMEDGLHRIDYMLVADNGATTTQGSAWFLKIPQTENVGDLSVICVIDGKIAAEQELPMYGGVITWDMDVSNIDVGLHKAMFQIVTPSGAGSSIAETYFIRTITDAEVGTMQCSYVIDGFKHYTHKGTQSNGVFHFDLPVDDMEDGLHRIDYMLVADNGVTTTQGSAWFFKTPVGGNGITQYDYWLNSKSDEVQSVTLATPTNPFNLISLLPVTAEPIRSSCFHFDFKDGQPMMYAKNDIHFRFHDKSGRWVDADNQYVDYNVSQEVTGIANLLPTQTFENPDSNCVKWFSFDVAPGDTAAFKLNQPATVQVFAPSGKEVFKTSESASVKWSGIHTWEDGTYYLAVHDVTGSQSTMSLDYMHMDKYDVVDWDVHTVGNGGCSTITFKGNGFRDLYAVDLVIAPGDTIHSVDVSHDSDAETAVTFDFTDATLGEYNAMFHFTEEDMSIANVVTVEEAKDIELATMVTFPSAFPHGRSTTYTVKITNKGNMTAYSVPVYTWIMNKLHKDGIYHIEYNGLNLPGLFDGVNMDSLTVSEKAEVQALADEIGDAHYFMLFRAENEDSPGDSVWVRSNYFFTNIAPYETKTLKLTLSANEGVWAYFTVPDEWVSFSIEKDSESFSARARFASRRAESWYCCYRERIECVANITVNGLDIASLFSVPGPTAVNIASCVASSLNQILTAAGDTFCGTNDVEGDFMKKVNQVVKGISVTGALASCASAFGVKGASEFTAALDGLLHPFVATSCIQAFFSKKPGCPPTPHSGGNSGGGSWDPNDIFGYLSQAGSHFITDSVACINYTIEFENDTTMAMAAAHTIVIKDTLDRRYFDLNSFMPIAIKIGNHEVLLTDRDISTSNGTTNFLKTIDMRPAIYAIAQVEGAFNQQTGIAEWRFTSLDPMTMEPAEDIMQGILPVNYDGISGIGEIMFEVGIKQGKADGTEIENRASIVFDANAPILTPTWTNIVDAVAPTSFIDDSWMVNDSTLRITADGFDARSGVWKYTWYVQAGENAPWWKEGETDSCSFDYHIYEGIDYGFCVLATDSAGNVEQKVIQRERSFKTYGPDYEDGISPLPNSPEEEEPVYDLSGRQIGNGKSSNGNYPKGVIIRNRRKTLVTE